ncbi:GBS Bsp-like repeat-containing protein [Streptococcus salivarius]|uniref:GBS Bsp-like repeat-containing protein n=1 Tax=Streptococcus salivarius TaxID=1304 RepID=UPI0012BCFACC|nr:GBS Bsp-like repeat-containing protein [Streptococcus salivarius]MTQ28989.1 glycosyl hydrolase family 25 [Streptococcus salivarius]MTQ43538.1 glycosyl hydrolase family 25 [Streptococcus salivarius]MTQ45034.1 glycosyl hydrolase family 25 [Streptococcus salivarius]MTR96742.1 glycosyl hydrolase family 25 [Streptococcus salivarius]
MRTKDFIYYASAAVLLAVTTQVAQADEVATQTPSVTEGNQYQSVIAAEIFGGEAALPVTPKSTVSAPAATSEVAKASAPAVSTSPASQSSEAATASTSVTSSVVSSESATASTSATNSETSNSAVATPAKLTNSTDVPSPTLKVQPKTFIDVSSHNGDISVDDYRALARQGVGGVVVKLTEDTWYNNPKAPSQVRNAQIAGLQVSTYHFSRYTTEEEARAEARFYIQAAQKLNLPKSTVMVNDFEDSNMLPNINRNTQAWVNEMRKHGYNNLMFYTSASWLDENNLGYRGPVSTSQFGIENFWVAQYPSSSLTATSAKNMRYNAKTGAWQFSATANLLPGKHVFDQSVDYTGRFTANASVEADPTQGDLSGTISIVNNNPTLGSFDVVISNVKAPNGVQTVSVPIWSEINGQDDIIWYTANRQNNGTYTVNVKASAHKNSTGLYNVHLYYVQKDGQLTGVGGTTTQVFIGKKPEISVFANLSISKNENNGTFTIIAKNLKGLEGYKEVKIPFWSHANGMSDIKWYTPTRQADGSYTVTVKASDHENANGRYEAQVFYIDARGQKRFVQKAFSDYSNGQPTVPVSANLSISKNENNGTFTIIAKNLKGLEGYKEVKIPFWSHANGMSDIKWYTPTRQADGSYTVTVKASDHENANGRYEAQVFYIDARGQKRFVQKAFVERNDPSKPTGVISITNNKDSGTFDVVISDVYSPKGVRTVQVPIWSEVDGQDDIRWYEAVRQTNGSYKVTVQVANHKYSTGIYNVHLYYIQNDGSQIGVGGTQTNVTLSEPKADLAITGLNNATGSYDVVISNLIAPRGFKEVLVPTWSEKNGQDDIIWYKATMQANGDYKVTVRSSNHKGDSGLYNSHVYLVDNDGKYIGLGGKQATLDITKTQGTLTIANNDKNRGTFDVLITNLTNPSGISGVVIPVWSEQNGQDDLVWHNATKQDDGSYKVTISASQHKWNSGKYIVHGYIVDVSGKNIGFGATSADVVAPKKIGSASRGNYDVLNKIVYLDAGHGGYDPGASYFGISEKSLTLAIQSRVKAKLEAEGYQVVTTRTSDTYVDLADRSRAANASESDIFVSIHINASGSSAAQGIETYYYQPYAEYPSRINATYHANPTRLSMSDTLANAIQSSLINATGAQNQGVKRQTFAVLRETTAPAVLLELGFLSNPQEAARLNTSAYQETLANAIVAGIKRYYSIYN